MSPTAESVLAFWFAEDSATRWFDADAAFDAQIRNRFGAVAAAAAAGELDGWTRSPLGWLALLLLLDQFSRNLFRDDARAWAQDSSALAWALTGLERGDDRALAPLQRVFVYLPLEHAEDLAVQHRSVALFEVLCAESSAEQRAVFEGYLDYARRHRDVIARFGRFPHRNARLGRPSTAQEAIYLAQPGAGF